MNLMYKCVDFIREIYLGYLKKNIFILSNTCYGSSLLNDTFIIIFDEKQIDFNIPL